MHQLRAYTFFRRFTPVFHFNDYCHQAVGQEWDAINLYIANNIDWMKVWIEQCKQSGHGISWEDVASLVKETHRNGDRNLTEREIDLAYGLKDKMASILINPSKSFYFTNYFFTCMLFFSMYCCITTELLCNIFVYFLLQVKHHKAMVYNV